MSNNDEVHDHALGAGLKQAIHLGSDLPRTTRAASSVPGSRKQTGSKGQEMVQRHKPKVSKINTNDIKTNGDDNDFMVSEESIQELKSLKSKNGSSSMSGLPKGIGDFLSKDERHISSDIVLRFLKTRVTFLQDAQDKDLKALVYAKPPKINFH